MFFSKKPQHVKKNWRKRFDQLNKETEEIFSKLSEINDDLLQKKGKGWSVIQVLSHLEMSEAYSLRYMKKKVQAGSKMNKERWQNKFRNWFSNRLQTTNLRWKAPTYISNPPDKYNLDEIKKHWMGTRKEIEKYIDDYPEKFLNRLVYKHPLAGRQSLKGAIDFFIYHQRHHKRQMDRMTKSLGI